MKNFEVIEFIMMIILFLVVGSIWSLLFTLGIYHMVTR